MSAGFWPPHLREGIKEDYRKMVAVLGSEESHPASYTFDREACVVTMVFHNGNSYQIQMSCDWPDKNSSVHQVA